MEISKMLNIRNINYEETIKDTIKETKEEYKNLTDKQTCFIYSSIINEKLRQKHLITRIISTKDLGIDYEHRFVFVKDAKDYYVIDLTYKQFFKNIPKDFISLGNNGYQKGDKELLNNYILSIFSNEIDKDADEMFFKSK